MQICQENEKSKLYTNYTFRKKKKEKKINVTTAKIHGICQEKTKSSQTQFLYSGIIHLKPPKNLTKAVSGWQVRCTNQTMQSNTHTQTLSILFKN